MLKTLTHRERPVHRCLNVIVCDRWAFTPVRTTIMEGLVRRFGAPGISATTRPTATSKGGAGTHSSLVNAATTEDL